MIKVVYTVVVAGILLIVAGGIANGFDSTTVVILGLAVGVGLLAVGVTRRFAQGLAGPATCSECGKSIAPSSPYCKHCGALR
ncbi:MAG: zinc ribbon domain-containing protein [Actinomycetota bacterium]